MQDIGAQVGARRRHWLVTGAAGFIGSHLLETLLRLDQQVTSLDNFSTGYQANLDDVRDRVGEAAWSRHRAVRGDVADERACADACAGVDIVLHQAALGSVSGSIAQPLLSHRSNVTGFLTLLVAARTAGARFVYASSSAAYGDSAALPSGEEAIGNALSPYAVTKRVDELYADVFARCYGMQSIGLRYFNVFGARQDPQGAYAAVIPLWARAMLDDVPCVINGDGETSRDFCHVDDVVQANLRAGLASGEGAVNRVYNVGLGQQTSLNRLHGLLASAIRACVPGLDVPPPVHGPSRPGDIRHSMADIAKAVDRLGFRPMQSLEGGLASTARWYALARGAR